MNTRWSRVLVLVGVVVMAVFGILAVRGEATAAAPPAGDLAAEVESLRHEVAELRALVATGGVIHALEHLEVPDKLELCGQTVPLDRPENREALAFELVLTVGKPTMPLLWMRRAPLVMGDIESRLKEHGLPEDLKYVPMIESDMRWTPESPAGAVGLWQFVARTGKRFGLRVDSYLDERMDPDRSTEAALGYLADLRKQFNDWYLALAAYNVGEAAVQHAITEQGTRNYFDLFLPVETRRYVFRLAAAKLVYEHPERYGLFRMAPLYQPRYRRVEVNLRQSGDVRELARAQNVTYAALRVHNPQIRGSSLPAGRFRVRVPGRETDADPGTPAATPGAAAPAPEIPTPG